MNDWHSLKYTKSRKHFTNVQMKNCSFPFFYSFFFSVYSSRFCRHCPPASTFISTNDRLSKWKRERDRKDEIERRKKIAANSSDGYQSKSKMPEISMKRLRNAIFFLPFFLNFTFPALWLSTTLKQFISVSVDRIIFTFHLRQMAAKSRQRKKNHFSFQTIWLESSTCSVQ